MDQAPQFIAARDHLAHKGVLAPEHISMACYDQNSYFDWFRPEITRIEWNPGPVITRVVKWVNNVSQGKQDRRQNMFRAKLIPGGTIGPAAGGRRSTAAAMVHAGACGSVAFDTTG